MLQWYNWALYKRIRNVYQYSTGNWQLYLSFNTGTLLASIRSKQMSISSFKPCSITCCSYSPEVDAGVLLIPLQARKKEERFVNKSLVWGFCKMCLWAFLQRKQCNHFIVCEGQLQRASGGESEILLNPCSTRAE